MVKEISQESSLLNILNNDEPDWCDYPYIGIGEKPMSKNRIGDEHIEKMMY